MKRFSANLNGPIWLTIAHGSYALFQWILIILLSRFFGLQQLGLYTSTMAILTPIVLVSGLNSRGVQLADVAGQWTLREVFATRLAGMTLAFGLLALYVGVAVDTANISIWLILFCRTAAEAIAEPVHTWLIATRRFRKFAFTYLIRSVLSVGTFVLLALLGAPLIVCLGGWAGVAILLIIVRDLRFGGFVRPSSLLPVDLKRIRSFALASVPLAAVGVINSLYVSIPILFLKGHSGLEQVGLYSAVSYVNMVIGLFVGAVTLSSARGTAVAYSEGLNELAMKRIHRQLIFVCLCGLPALIAMALFGEAILEVLYDTDGSGYRGVILMQLSAVVLQAAASVFGVAATAARRNRHQVVIGIACIAVQFILCYLLVSRMGPFGAAIGTAASFGLKAACLYVVLPRPRQATN